MRKQLSLLLSMLLAFSCFALHSFAVEIVASGNCGRDMQWRLDSDGKMTIFGMGKMYNYTPEDYILTENDSKLAPWYKYKDQIHKVYIEDGPQSIGEYAFYFCQNISDISISNTVTTIGSYAFDGCSSLKMINIPEDLKEIENGTFENCVSLQSISIPKSVGYVWSAFENCSSLSDLYFHENISIFIFSGLKGCNNLEKITIDKNNQYYSSNEEGVVFNKDKTELVYYPCGKKQADYVVPSGIKTIGSYAFYDNPYLENVTIPDSVNEIESNAFSGCVGLKNIVYNNNINSIDYWTYENCDSLVSVIIPSNITKLEFGCFSWCKSLRTVVIQSKIEIIEHSSFSGCEKLEYIYIPKSVRKIESYAFDSVNLQKIFYEGSKTEWYNIEIEEDNDTLDFAPIEYNSSPDAVPFVTGDISRFSDFALLTDEKEQKIINEKLDMLSKKNNLDIVIVTVNTTGFKNYQEWTNDFYYNNDFGISDEKLGVVLFINGIERSYYITTFGYCNELDENMDKITESILPLLKQNDFYNAFLEFADQCDIILNSVITPDFAPGDVDGSGEIEVTDARYALRVAVGLENYAPDSAEFLAADTDGDGEIEVSDARNILRAAVGLDKPEDWKTA